MTPGRSLFLPLLRPDGAVYTGQNPASSAELAQRLIAELG